MIELARVLACPCTTAPNREAAMVVIRESGPDRRGGIWCDPCLVPLVKALNEGGLPTVASCCGHGRVPGNVALADGRILVIADGLDHMERMLHA